MSGEAGNTGARSGEVRRRQVFYIPGYDPIHPRRYRELYRKEGAAQAGISGYEIGLSPAPGGSGRYGWQVEGRFDGATVAAQVEVLVWSDIVRGSMSNSIPATYWHLLRTAWIYIATGTLRRLMWLRKGPVIAALYPVGMLLVQLAAAVGLGAVLGGLAVRVIESLIILTGWPLGWAAPVLRWPILLVTTVLALRWFKARDGDSLPIT